MTPMAPFGPVEPHVTGWSPYLILPPLACAVITVIFLIQLGIGQAPVGLLVFGPCFFGGCTGLLIANATASVRVYQDRVEVRNVVRTLIIPKACIKSLDTQNGILISIDDSHSVKLSAFAPAPAKPFLGNRRAKLFARKMSDFLELDSQSSDGPAPTVITTLRYAALLPIGLSIAVAVALTLALQLSR